MHVDERRTDAFEDLGCDDPRSAHDHDLRRSPLQLGDAGSGVDQIDLDDSILWNRQNLL